MEFNSFQNDTAKLIQFGLDFGGNKATIKSIDVQCDVQFEVKRITNSSGEEVTTFAKVFVSPNTKLNNLNTNDTWLFDYKDEQYTVERFMRVRYPGSSAISHYELMLK